MACDFRIAAESATFGQPEINLGIIPGFGGTQRLRGSSARPKALEMNLVGDPISAYEALRLGLANAVVPDHELFDTALNWAAKLAGQAPIAIEKIKQVSANGDLDAGLDAEKAGVRGGVRQRGRQGGHRRLPAEAQRQLQGRVGLAQAGATSRAAELARGAARGRPSGRPDRRGRLGPLRHSRLPLARHRHLGERQPDGGRPHRRLPRATRTASGASTPSASPRCARRRPNRGARAIAELERRGLVRGVITQNVDRLHRAARVPRT